MILLVLAGCDWSDQQADRKAEKSDIELTAEYLADKWTVAYLHLYCDLPDFYFVPLEEMTEFDSRIVRIWDKGDLTRGRCEKELRRKLSDRKLAEYWHGPYMVCPIPGRTCWIGRHPVKDATRDIWGRRYRMFYYTFQDVSRPTETEKRLIPSGEKGVMILLSGGPDGRLQSCASDKSDRKSMLTTAPEVERANHTHFRNFEPFHPGIEEPDPFAVLSEGKLKEMKDKALKDYQDFLRKEGR